MLLDVYFFVIDNDDVISLSLLMMTIMLTKIVVAIKSRKQLVT